MADDTPSPPDRQGRFSPAAFAAGGSASAIRIATVPDGPAGRHRGRGFGALTCGRNLSLFGRRTAWLPGLLRGRYAAAGTGRLEGHRSLPPPGDLVLSRDENLLGGPIEPTTIEEIFVRMARIMQWVVRGITIDTLAEHPFWVLGKGRLPAGEPSESGFRVRANASFRA